MVPGMPRTPLQLEARDDRYSGLALVDIEQMDGALLFVNAQKAGEPFESLGPRGKYLAAITPHLRLGHWLERRMKLALPLAQFCIGQSSERNVARATRENANPCLARRAHPKRAVIIAVRVRIVAEPRQFGVSAAIFADGLRREWDGAADAHKSKEVRKTEI
jgi:hypothetical protein